MTHSSLKRTVLIVEDDAILAVHLRNMLIGLGYGVPEPVATGEAAIATVAAERPDLVLMDIQLAGIMDGITAAGHIHSAADVPIVFLTGYSQDPLLQRAKTTVPYGYLLKPVSQRELAATIEMALYRHMLDRRLQESEERYRTLVEQASDGIFLVDREGHLINVNIAGCQLLGCTHEEILQKTISDLTRNMPDRSLRLEALRQGKTLLLEQETWKKDGTRITVEISAKQLSDGSFQGIFRDITGRKMEEAALKKAHDELEERVSERTVELKIAMNALKNDEERFRTVADFTNDWESWIGPDGRYIYVSPSCKSVSGYLPRDFYEDPFLLEKIIHPQDLPAWKRIAAEGLEGKGAAAFDFRIITRGGEERWISFKGQAVYGRDGSWLGRRDSNRDTTDRKQAEEELKESRARFRALVENTHDWVWEMDRNGVYGYVSPRSMDLLGYTPEEIAGRSPLDFLHPDKVKGAMSRLKKILEAGEPFRGIERTCRHKEGHSVIVETSGVPFFDSLGNPAGFRGIDRDITERKNMESLALRTRHLAAIGELAAGMAHEINNPINGIINYAQILEDDASASGGDPEIPRRIIKEGDRIADIVKNLLFFSRQSNAEKQPVSIHRVLEDSLALFAAQFRKEEIHASVDIPDDIPPVMANRQQIQQVFMNILANSRHALLGKPNGFSPKRQVEIKARRPESKGVKMVALSFFDNGTGIAPELLERIFDPFFTTKPAGEGTGLGLSISYGIVKDHGGNLIIESEPGEYTRVKVNLPVSTAD
jgi:PAS domain S-box-containing protein